MVSMPHRWFFVIHRAKLAFLRERFGGLDVESRLLPLLVPLVRDLRRKHADWSREVLHGVDAP
jgi:ABC-type phosphonate transport system ATPase subunit